jgi:hypothetical protein
MLLATVGVAVAVGAGVAWRAEVMRFDFDKDAVGALPKGWKAEGTKQQGTVATWQVIADSTAPSQPNALMLTKVNHTSNDTCNICWNDSVKFEDGMIELSFRSDSGKSQQGGGPVWRVKDANNYYVCCASPIEGNFRIYPVKDGTLKQLATADSPVPTGKWHTIKIEHRGDNIVASLNGKKLLEAKDATLKDAGGVGLWTKADAVTAFDDIKINAGPGGDKKELPPLPKEPKEPGNQPPGKSGG